MMYDVSLDLLRNDVNLVLMMNDVILDPLKKDVNLVLMMNDVSLVSLRNDVSHLEADIPRQKSVTNPKITHHVWRSAAAVNRGSIKIIMMLHPR